MIFDDGRTNPVWKAQKMARKSWNRFVSRWKGRLPEFKRPDTYAQGYEEGFMDAVRIAETRMAFHNFKDEKPPIGKRLMTRWLNGNHDRWVYASLVMSDEKTFTNGEQTIEVEKLTANPSFEWFLQRF